jgi:hypothetical protein
MSASIYELLTQINNYVLLLNFAVLFLLLVGKGFHGRLAGIGRSPKGLLIISCFVFGTLTFLIEDPLIELATTTPAAVWPVRIVWYFGFATLNLAVIWISLSAIKRESYKLSGAFKSALFTLSAKAFVCAFGFIDRFAFNDALAEYYQLSVPTLNISLIALMAIMVFKLRVNEKKALKVDVDIEKLSLLESGAKLYLDTIKEPDFLKAQNNHEVLKAKFNMAVAASECENIDSSNIYQFSNAKEFKQGAV